jgi:hypothetical protein
MPPKGWKKNAAGEWYDPALVGEAPGEESTSEDPQPVQAADSEAVAESESVEERGQSLTKIPSKQRKFQKGT